MSAGQIQYKVEQWEQIIDDKWVLKTIQGYEILFDERPYQLKKPSQISFNDQETMVVNDEIKELLLKKRCNKRNR